MGKGAGLDSTELAANLRGRSANARTQAALDFAAAIVSERGRISDAQLSAVRAAGYSDAEVVEIVGHVAINIFTNYFNHIADTVVDFPVVRSAAPVHA
jgi:alkylhydroperoxidase family enzyme